MTIYRLECAPVIPSIGNRLFTQTLTAKRWGMTKQVEIRGTGKAGIAAPTQGTSVSVVERIVVAQRPAHVDFPTAIFPVRAGAKDLTT